MNVTHLKRGQRKLPMRKTVTSPRVERAQSTWRYVFYATYDLPQRIDKLQAFVDAFTHRTTIGRTTRLPDKLRQSISKLSAKGDPPPSHMY